jgi:hypothetical protein
LIEKDMWERPQTSLDCTRHRGPIFSAEVALSQRVLIYGRWHSTTKPFRCLQLTSWSCLDSKSVTLRRGLRQGASVWSQIPTGVVTRRLGLDLPDRSSKLLQPWPLVPAATGNRRGQHLSPPGLVPRSCVGTPKGRPAGSLVLFAVRKSWRARPHTHRTRSSMACEHSRQVKCRNRVLKFSVPGGSPVEPYRGASRRIWAETWKSQHAGSQQTVADSAPHLEQTSAAASRLSACRGPSGEYKVRTPAQ